MYYTTNFQTFQKLFNFYCYELGLEYPQIFESIDDRAEFHPPFDMEEFWRDNTVEILHDEHHAIGFLAYSYKDNQLSMNEVFIMEPFLTKKRVEDCLNHMLQGKTGSFTTHLSKSFILFIDVLKEKFSSLKQAELDDMAWIFSTEL